MGVGPGDDVATVSHSFVATANAVIACGARPVFVDVEASTLGMDAGRLEAALTPRTRAVLCVHQLGIPCDLEGILAVAERHGLPVVEDAACAVGSEVLTGWTPGADRPAPRTGGLLLLPSRARSSPPETGGCSPPPTPRWPERFRLLRQHAMSIPDTVRHAADRIVFEEYLEPAYNHRLTDLQAAVGRPQLARLDAIVAERRRLAERYRRALEGSEVLLPPAHRPRGAHVNHQSYPLRLRPGTGLTQLAAMQHLQERGIASKRGVSNAHQEPAYRVPGRYACGPTACGAEHAAGHCARLPNSERLRDETILIPLFHGMEDTEQDAVLRALAELTPSSGSNAWRNPPVTPRPTATPSSASPTTSSSESGSPSAPS